MEKNYNNIRCGVLPSGRIILSRPTDPHGEFGLSKIRLRWERSWIYECQTTEFPLTYLTASRCHAPLSYLMSQPRVIICCFPHISFTSTFIVGPTAKLHSDAASRTSGYVTFRRRRSSIHYAFRHEFFAWIQLLFQWVKHRFRQQHIYLMMTPSISRSSTSIKVALLSSRQHMFS